MEPDTRSCDRARPAHGPRSDGKFVRLSYRPPFDWEWLLAFLAARIIPGVEEVVSGSYRRSFEHKGRHGILEVRHAGRARSLEARIRFSQPLSLLPIVTRLSGMFDLTTDVSVIAEHLGRDPLLAPLVRKYPAPRVPGAWDGFELAVRAILGQQVTVAAASTLAGRLARQFGQRLSFPDSGGLTVLFPSPYALANAQLRGIPGTRGQAIRSLAQAVASGSVALGGATTESVQALARLPGIGDWTAQYIAMRALREPDAFPAGDLVLRRVAGGGQPLTIEAMRERAERWRPWRAYAAIYLWRAASDEAHGEPFEGVPPSSRRTLAHA